MRTASLNNVALGGGNVRQRVLFSPLTSKGQSTPLASVKAQIQKFDRKRKSSCPGRFRGMEVKWTFQMSEIPEMWTVHRMNRSLSAPTLDRPFCTPYTIPLFGFRLTREFIFEEVENRIYKSIVMVFLVFSTQILNGKKKGKNQVTPINRFAASKNLNFASPIGREIRILPARKAIHLLQSSLCRPRTELLWGARFSMHMVCYFISDSSKSVANNSQRIFLQPNNAASPRQPSVRMTSPAAPPTPMTPVGSDSGFGASPALQMPLSN